MSQPRIEATGALSVRIPGEPDPKLRQAAKQLEGVFVEHLFAAMRETVPEGGLVDGGSGEDIFTSLLDRHLADELASGWERGIGAAVFRQLSAAIADANAPAAAPPLPGAGE